MKNLELPNNVEMEKSVLAALLLKNGAVIPKVSSILSVDDFYRTEHKIIFKTILKLFSSGSPIDVLSLLEELRKTKDIDKTGYELIYALADAGYTTAYAEHHASIIKEKSIRRNLFYLSEHLADDAQNDLKSISNVIADTQTILQSVSNSSATSSVDFSLAFKNNFRDDIELAKKFALRKTGFDNIDKFQIFSPGLYVIGATPAAGKTTFCWQLLEQLARNGEKCIYCSYEMSYLELLCKSAARKLFQDDKQTTLSAADIRRGGWTRKLDSIIDSFSSSELNFKIFQLQDESVDDLFNLLNPFCSDNSAPVVCLDYLQIIPHGKDTAKSGIDDIVRKLKNFQRNTNTTFIVISSFNRTNYAQSVAFESFKESGGIEYSADVVWALQLNILNQLKSGDISKNRELIEQAKNANPRQVQLKCLKNRQGFNYHCFFNYFPAHDYFETCDKTDFEKNTTEYNNID